MHDQKLEMIMELMEELQEEMGYSEGELGERLGRPKVDVEILEEDTEPMEGMEIAMDGEDEEEGPEALLKQRLMKLRG